MNLEDSLQTKGLQKLLKKGLQILYKQKCWLRERFLQPHSDWDTLQKKSSLRYLTPCIFLQTSYLSLDFIFENYREHFNSIRANYFLLLLPACILTKNFIHSSVCETWFTALPHWHCCSTLSIRSFSAHQRGSTTVPVSSTTDLCQFVSTRTVQSNTLEINATIYKGEKNITAILPGNMPSQNQ